MQSLILKDKRVFVVEDDVTNMAIISVVLKGAGALVLQDHWNSGTLNMIVKYLPVDIILLDLMLRYQVSGYDLFKQIKADPRLATIPIVAVSAADPAVEIPRAQEMGFSGFISKPIVLQQFPSQIFECLSNQPVWFAR